MTTRSISIRLTEDLVAWLTEYGDGSYAEGIRRAVDALRSIEEILGKHDAGEVLRLLRFARGIKRLGEGDEADWTLARALELVQDLSG